MQVFEALKDSRTVSKITMSDIHPNNAKQIVQGVKMIISNLESLEYLQIRNPVYDCGEAPQHFQTQESVFFSANCQKCLLVDYTKRQKYFLMDYGKINRSSF